MVSFPLVYHEGYDLKFGSHVFPAQKYRMIRDQLLDQAIAAPHDFVLPEQASREQLLLAHTEEWIRKLETGNLSFSDLARLEVPYSQPIVQAYFLAAGGTILAARLAHQQGLAFNLAGGFHHAFAGHGEGFCAVNDVAVAIRTLQREGTISKALTIDCDVHHGNGTAAIFAGDPSVFTLSFHQLNNYPTVKPPSTVDVDLGDGAGDREYLTKLREIVPLTLESFQPDLIVYLAGVDPYQEDQLGGLALTQQGLRQRDEIVFENARRLKIPIAVTLAGGYARRLQDTVDLHVNTVKAACSIIGPAGTATGTADPAAAESAP